jgi:Rnl2 family RNA ligase
MEFQKYNSLEQANKQKTINAAVDAGHAKIMYGVTEKIHGANFGIHWERGMSGVKFSRRSDFLEDGETFYSHTKIEQALIKRMSKLVAQFGEDAETISVYGEIYGGSLNGVSAEGSKRVQKEVQYSPETQFAAFDLVVDGHYAPQYTAIRILGDTCGFHMVPLIALCEGLEEALAVDIKRNSIVPALLGYEVEGKNIIEGVVIRPWDADIYLPNGKHFILKNKNADFKEDSGKPAKVQEPMSDGDEALFSLVSMYLVKARLNAVISKEKELTHKDFGRILGLFMQDALHDFDTESDDEAVKDAADDYKRLNKSLQKVAAGIVREYWTTEL